MARKANKPSNEIDATAEDNVTQDIEAAPMKKSITKAGAARAALADGVVVPKEASRYILERFGLSISPQQFSAEKSRLKHRIGDQDASNRFGANGFVHPSRSPVGEADLLQALEAIKPLIDSLGVDKVKRMVELLG